MSLLSSLVIISIIIIMLIVVVNIISTFSHTNKYEVRYRAAAPLTGKILN